MFQMVSRASVAAMLFCSLEKHETIKISKWWLNPETAETFSNIFGVQDKVEVILFFGQLRSQPLASHSAAAT